MKNPLVCVANAVRMAVYTIRYSRTCKIDMRQSFEHIRIEKKSGGYIRMGKFNQNRGNMYIGNIGGNLVIGSHCFFNINASITCAEEISIGDFCKFGNNLVIVDHDHNFRTKEPEFVSAPIRIGNNVWIGANVTILRGTTIGDNCVIGAGTVIKGDIPANTKVICKNQIVKSVLEKNG